ncbi:hypothetical protein LTR66_017879 [Elasticomyces elasticus]|nr:hypothetical protein LTR66_017879 [Elasticomyces elasticus]
MSQSSAMQQVKETTGTVAENLKLNGAFDTVQKNGTNNSNTTETVVHGNEHNVKLSREEADRLYEERMEDEYAKREGGA